MPLFTEVTCRCDDREYPLRSMNISDTGMLLQLLQPAPNIDLGQEVFLEFKIAELRASLNVIARIVRNEGTDRVGVSFIGLAPEDQNAIQLYVMGRLAGVAAPKDLTGFGMHRLFTP